MEKRVIRTWYREQSLNRKIALLVCLAGLLPVGILLVLSLVEMQNRSEEQQLYALNQGYVQVAQAVEDKMTRVHNISTLLAVSDVINLSLTLTDGEKSVAQQLLDFENIDSYTYGMEMAFESSNVLFYIDESFPVVNNYSGRYRPFNTVEQTDWYQSLEDNNGRPTWVSFQEDVLYRDQFYVAITRKLWNRDDYSREIGILAVLLERKYLDNLLISSVQQQIIYIEASDGQILASNLPEEEIIRLPVMERAVNDDSFREINLEGKEFLVRSTLIDDTNTYLISMIPVDVMKEQAREVNMSIGMIYLIVCIVILLAFIPITKSVTGRLQLLKDQMLQIQKGVIKKIETDKSDTDEIGQLIVHYNEMVDKVEELMEEQYILGQEKTGAELKALQSQISPHFLYNTLDMINWMAQKNETDNIRNVVQSMSRFYRLTLSRGHDIVTIADEIKMCGAYMEIQERRYRGRIRFEVEVENDIMDCLIPKITLQPFLENAIIHGINEKEIARGVILLNGWMEDGRITLSVTDDGIGMTEDDRSAESTGSHYGMKNIADRMKLFYGEDIPIQVESSLGIGTCVIINIPARRNPEEERRQS